MMEADDTCNTQISAYKDFDPRTRPTVRPWYNDAEMKRKKRVAKYKMYAIEGKVKSKWNKGLRWLKKACSKIVHGY